MFLLKFTTFYGLESLQEHWGIVVRESCMDFPFLCYISKQMQNYGSSVGSIVLLENTVTLMLAHILLWLGRNQLLFFVIQCHVFMSKHRTLSLEKVTLFLVGKLIQHHSTDNWSDCWGSKSCLWYAPEESRNGSPSWCLHCTPRYI